MPAMARFDLSARPFIDWPLTRPSHPHAAVALLADTSPFGQAVASRLLVDLASVDIDPMGLTAMHALAFARHPTVHQAAERLLPTRASQQRSVQAARPDLDAPTIRAIWDIHGPDLHPGDLCRLLLAHPNVPAELLVDVGQHHRNGSLAAYARLQPAYPADPEVWLAADPVVTGGGAATDPSHPLHPENHAAVVDRVNTDRALLARWFDQHRTAADRTGTLSAGADIAGRADRLYDEVLALTDPAEVDATIAAAAAA